MDSLYGTFDERKFDQGESTALPDYVESTTAGKYLTRDPQTGNMLATKALIDLENTFETNVLLRAHKAREHRPVYKYPERTARLTGCSKGGCSHDSEDDETDESDVEEGEIKDEPGLEKHEEPETKESKVPLEIQAKLDHPERLNRFLCFNDRGESNYGPVCKCSRRARRFGVRHCLYGGETLIENCRPDSNNADKLYHYRIGLSSVTNFKVANPTVISWDSRDYTFDGFSLLTHVKMEQMSSFKTILFSSYYTVSLVEEVVPPMFTVRTLDLVCDYLFYELLELVDVQWVQPAFKDGCRQIHIMPRFTRPLPDNGLEVLAMPHVLKYLLERSVPVVEDVNLAAVAAMDKKTWDEQVVKKYQFSLVTIPGMRPSTLRVDNMDRLKQQTTADSSLISYPQILHYVLVSDSLSFFTSESVLHLNRKKIRLLKHFSKKMIPLTNSDITALRDIQYAIQKAKDETENTALHDMRKEKLVELSCQGFFGTGLCSDVAQWGILIPKVVDYVRFSLSLATLQTSMGYKFKDPANLQLALSHSSYMNGFSTNMDHIKNCLTNCGLRRLTYGRFPLYKELKVKKRGLRTLLETMSRNYRQFTGPIYSNERLEFLGDAVLEFITTVHLFYIFPKLEEGGLSTFRTAIIKNEHLTILAKCVGLQHYLLYSHGPDLCHSAQFNHALANAFEAILGAIFLDGGLDAADRFLSKYLRESLNFEEFTPVWTRLPLHPVQELYPNGDRHLIEASPALQKCAEFEKLTGLHFDHVGLLARALTHSSMIHTNFSGGTNQTLEFLGDSVLQLIVSDHLFRKYPNHHEGHLTLLRSSLVNNPTQAQIYADIGVGQFTFKRVVDSGANSTPVKERADYVEAILGALYVDQGIDVCKVFCRTLFFPRLKETIECQNWNDAKSLLQQCCLELRNLDTKGDPELPVYRLIGQSGPTHLRTFKVAVYFKDQRIGVGEGRGMRKAQFDAAQNALDSNHAMFPMLQPGTNKLLSLNGFAMRYVKRKKAIRMKRMSKTSGNADD